MQFGQGVYRFKSDGSVLEFLGSTTNNTWGMCFTEDNLLFGSTANGNPSVYMPIPNRYYEKVRCLTAGGVLQSIADTNRMFPVTEKVTQTPSFFDLKVQLTLTGCDLVSACAVPDIASTVEIVSTRTATILNQCTRVVLNM